MNKRKVFSFLTAIALGMTSMAVTPVYVSAAGNTAAVVADTSDNVVKRYGDIVFQSTHFEKSIYTGEKPDFDDIELRVAYYLDSGDDASIIPEIGSFTVGSGKFSDLYTLDTSNVDTTETGKYLIKLTPKAGASLKVSSQYDTTYDLSLKGTEKYLWVDLYVYDKETAKDTPLYLRFFTEAIEVPAGDGIYVNLEGALASDVTYKVDDETIAKVDERSDSHVLVLNALKEGETTVDVYTSDGRKTSERIKVTPSRVTTMDPEEPLVTATTTLPDPNAPQTTKTTETTTTVVTVDKWWYKYENRPTTTTTAVWTSPATTTTVTGTYAVTSTVIYDYAPKIEFDTSYMIVGETREGRFYNPETKKNENGWIKALTDNISVEYTEGSDTFKVTALESGMAEFSCGAKGCAFTGYVKFGVAKEPATTVTATTTAIPTTSTVHYDYMTKVQFDNSPMNVGERRSISFFHPNGETEGGSVGSSSDLIEVYYENGLNNFEVKAVKEGEASIMVYARGCTFGAPITIKVVSNKKTKGDANCDEGIDMADAVYIMQSIVNPDKYKLSAVGKENADMDGGGVTVGDAQKIQRKLLGIDDNIDCELPSTQPIGVDTTEEAIELINNYDLSDYYEGYRDSLKDMFETFKDRGFICCYASKDPEKKIEVNSEFINEKIWLMPRMDYEDMGILYHVKSDDKAYQIYYYLGDDTYLGQSFGDYFKNRFGFGITKTIDDKYLIIDNSEDGQNDISVFYHIGGDFYCKVRGFSTEAELMELVNDLDCVKIPINDKLITDSSEKYPFEAEYVRVYATGNYNREPVIEKFNSEEEFLKRFNSESSKYNEKWFSEHKLILITLEEGSGSTRHKVTELTSDHVTIERINPQVMTCDWAVWNIYIELDKDAVISDDFSVEFTQTEAADDIF